MNLLHLKNGRFRRLWTNLFRAGARISRRDSNKIRDYFDAEFYLQNNEDVRQAGIDPLEHYLKYGWKEDRTPVPWFDASEYKQRFPDLIGRGISPFSHFIEYEDAEGARDAFRNASSLTEGPKLKQIIAEKRTDSECIGVYRVQTPSKKDIEAVYRFFDFDYYLTNNPDVAESHINPLVHFLTIGWIEGRDPSANFSVSHYLKHNKDIRESSVNPFVHYCKAGRNEKWRSTAGVAEAAILAKFDTSEKLQQMVKEAKLLEPMVALPDVQRNAIILVNNQLKLGHAARNLREALGARTYKHVILIPQVRMSGAARVASIFARVIAKISGDKSVLVVSTDGSSNEYKHWFNDDYDFFDASEIYSSVAESERGKLLYDLLRGVDAKAFYNINSLLAWQTVETYGRQLSQEFRVFTYLFTWDLSPRGTRVGYPIQWLRHTCDFHHVIMSDNASLSADIRTRLGYDGTGDTEVVTLYTPAEEKAIEAKIRKSVSTPPIFLWVGRFDRQKRPDILIDIARRMPDVIFHMYGKAVLDKNLLNPDSLPANCLLKGPYHSLEEVFQAEIYAGFLSTSQWEGIPTVLLDLAQVGLPAIAPAVGGIPEVISHETGYLIDQFDDIDAYCKAIDQVIANPSDAAIKAKSLIAFVRENFTESKYTENLSELLKRNVL